MPVLTDVQGYAAEILRKLQCARHDQIHWLISRMYPDVAPEKVMRQLVHISRFIDDGKHYLWSGCEVNPGRVAAIEVMLRLSSPGVPLFDSARHPCSLIFHLMKQEQTQAFRVYTPTEGEETRCQAIAENQREPHGHAAVFYVRRINQIPLLKVSRPHIFAVSDGGGGFSFQGAKL